MNRNTRLAQITKQVGRDYIAFTLSDKQLDMRIDLIKLENDLDDIEMGIYKLEKRLFI